MSFSFPALAALLVLASLDCIYIITFVRAKVKHFLKKIKNFFAKQNRPGSPFQTPGAVTFLIKPIQFFTCDYLSIVLVSNIIIQPSRVHPRQNHR